LLSRILEEAHLIAPFSFFANAASTLQESTLTYRRPMPKKNNLPTGGRNTALSRHQKINPLGQ
jgi:hypothetical protein